MPKSSFSNETLKIFHTTPSKLIEKFGLEVCIVVGVTAQLKQLQS